MLPFCWSNTNKQLAMVLQSYSYVFQLQVLTQAHEISHQHWSQDDEEGLRRDDLQRVHSGQVELPWGHQSMSEHHLKLHCAMRLLWVFVHFSLSLDIVLIDESFGLEILNLACQERHLPPTRVAFGGRWWVAMPSVNENGGRMVDIRSSD